MYLDSLKTITEPLTIYYDAACPLCQAEIHFLKHHNQRNLLYFIDLHTLSESETEVNCSLAMQTIHGCLGRDKIITGPSVFYEAYKRTDLKLINYLFSLAWFRLFYAHFYKVFAQHRHQISRWIGPYLLRLAKRRYQSDI
jgi:predicted DCC family thiol-disulfide oxidoreductase YuxK